MAKKPEFKVKKNLLDFWDDYKDASKETSGIIRNLSLAGIAIIWSFKKPDSIIAFVDGLKVPLLLFIVALTLDIIQYIWKSTNLLIFCRKQEIAFDKDKIDRTDLEDLVYPLWITNVTNAIFFIKIIVAAIGYYLMSAYVITKI